MTESSSSTSTTVAVPETVMESVNRTSANFKDFQSQFADFFPLCHHHTLSDLDPIHRAQTLLLLAKATTTLFALNLRCNGVDPDDHPVRSEFERLELYQNKLDKCTNLSKEPLRPSTTLNYQAATRFIEHSLPDLTPDQRKNMREISRREGTNRARSEGNASKRRKYLSSNKTSVKTAAQEFLEKATRELLGEDKGALKGPLKPRDDDDNDDDDDDDDMSPDS